MTTGRRAVVIHGHELLNVGRSTSNLRDPVGRAAASRPRSLGPFGALYTEIKPGRYQFECSD